MVSIRCETHWRESVDREVTQTRNSVGICDVSTLGKIDIQGRDAGEFLNRVYANTFATLAVGKVRYGVMLREDGIVMDDGTTARMAENHYVMTTTTANAVNVFRHMEFCRQCLWPNLDVQMISATEQWAQFAVAGPNARKLLQNVVDTDYPIDNESFPFMGCGDITVCGGTPARLFRISFSGELAYEIAVPTRYGNSMMEALIQAGDAFDAIPYGTEALGVMRIEKGHAAGNELTGQTTAANIGLGRMVSKKKDCIGNTLSEREGLNQDSDLALVGFKPTNTAVSLSAGAHFVSEDNEATTHNDEGWMTSVAYSPSLGHSIGLGFIERGQDRLGEVVVAADPLRGGTTKVKLCPLILLTQMENAYVANMTLQAQTPLAGYDHQFGQTRLSELSAVSIYSVALALSPANALASIKSALATQWPDIGHSTANESGTYRLLGLQSDQVFALVTGDQSDGAATALPTLEADAYVTDQSDSWAGLHIEGPAARDALERICPIDLHPTIFTVGQVTRTTMEHLAVIVHREAEDRYLLLSPSSSALSFLHAVETSLHNIQQ